MSVRQPLRKQKSSGNTKGKVARKSPSPMKPVRKRASSKHQEYGTSKLETYFAHEFLDKLGLRYIYEYEAKDIGRFYDFAIVDNDGVDFLTEEKNGITGVVQKGQNVPVSVIIEVDGSYVHGDPRVVNGGKLNRMQRKNKFVDTIKDLWCERHGYRLVRVWEYDIRHDPSGVMSMLEKVMEECALKKKSSEWRKKPH